MTAATALKFTLIPIVRIVFGVFPFNPNRWFGIGFAVYYCFSTPLLYQVCLESTERALFPNALVLEHLSFIRHASIEAVCPHVQAFTLESLVAAWHWTAASHNLWFVYLYAIRNAVWASLNPHSHPALQATKDTLTHQQVAVIPQHHWAVLNAVACCQPVHAQLQVTALCHSDIACRETTSCMGICRRATCRTSLPQRTQQRTGGHHAP